MKKIFIVLTVSVLFTILGYAQTPNQFKYQAVLRDNEGAIIADESVSVQIDILQSNMNGSAVFTENHDLTTTSNGIINLNIGANADLSVIDWSADTYFVKITVNGEEMGTSQLLSVPYAQFANEAGNAFSGNYNDLTNTPSLSELASDNNSINNQLKDISDPTDNQDAATKAYVDGLISILETGGFTVIEADFSADQDSIVIGQVVNFTDSSINPVSWSWDFGDGTNSTEQNPSHVYDSAGIYTVSLTVENSYGSDTETKTDLIITELNSTDSTVTDVEGNVYNTVVIGGQIWMAENLKTTSYKDGTPIDIEESGNWGTTENGAYCWYDNDSAQYAEIYGALYNGYAVVSENLCPTGWHVPTDDEWKTLEMFLGMSQAQADASEIVRGTNEGSKLAGDSNLWYGGAITDDSEFGSSGFLGLPGGVRYSYNTFSSNSFAAYWWTSTTVYTSPWYRAISNDETGIYRTTANNNNGYSVRCVKD